jgi:hypothetical protein
MEMILARSIAVHGPFDWVLMLRYARRRSRDRIDMVYSDSYSRHRSVATTVL